MNLHTTPLWRARLAARCRRRCLVPPPPPNATPARAASNQGPCLYTCERGENSIRPKKRLCLGVRVAIQLHFWVANRTAETSHFVDICSTEIWAIHSVVLWAVLSVEHWGVYLAEKKCNRITITDIDWEQFLRHQMYCPIYHLNFSTTNADKIASSNWTIFTNWFLRYIWASVWTNPILAEYSKILAKNGRILKFRLWLKEAASWPKIFAFSYCNFSQIFI